METMPISLECAVDMLNSIFSGGSGAEEALRKTTTQTLAQVPQDIAFTAPTAVPSAESWSAAQVARSSRAAYAEKHQGFKRVI
jgi:hypothetical protein